MSGSVSGPRIFVIGFNRCGTTSLHILFKRSGIRSIHYRADAGDVVLPARMASNYSLGRPILAGMTRFTAFMDMSLVTFQVAFEGNRYFRTLDADYPGSYFILNTRPVENWVRSRMRHLQGKFAENYANLAGCDLEKVEELWVRQERVHREQVEAHFAGRPEQLLIFDIESDSPDRIAAFLARDYPIATEHWAKRNAWQPPRPEAARVVTPIGKLTNRISGALAAGRRRPQDG